MHVALLVLVDSDVACVRFEASLLPMRKFQPTNTSRVQQCTYTLAPPSLMSEFNRLLKPARRFFSARLPLLFSVLWGVCDCVCFFRGGLAFSLSTHPPLAPRLSPSFCVSFACFRRGRVVSAAADGTGGIHDPPPPTESSTRAPALVTPPSRRRGAGGSAAW